MIVIVSEGCRVFSLGFAVIVVVFGDSSFFGFWS